MPINILVVGSKPCCQHEEVQTTGTREGTQPVQEELTCWSAEETWPMCLRGSCACLCLAEVVGDVSFWGVQRASVGQELGPFPCSAEGAGEGNRSLLPEKNLLLLNCIFLPPPALWRGVFRQDGWIPSLVSPAQGPGGQRQQQVHALTVQNSFSLPISRSCRATRPKPPPSTPAATCPGGCRRYGRF